MLQAKKKYGQNFLVSSYHLALLNESVEKFLGRTDHPHSILEIGPGMGALTRLILEICGSTSSLECWEIDVEAIAFLEDCFAEPIKSKKMLLRHLDALSELEKRLNLREAGDFDQTVLISNLPYNVGSRILVDLASFESQPRGFLVMLQKEVGNKLVAKSKNLNLLGGFLRLFYDFKIISDFPRSAFSPQPKVVSVLIEGILKKDLKISDHLDTLHTLKKLLLYPSKTLANNLKNLGWPSAKIQEFLISNHFDKNIRLEWGNYEKILTLVKSWKD